MISSEEKRKVLNEIIDGSKDPTKKEEVQKMLYDLMLRDTNGGKLYKYRSFDKDGYSLKNFEDGTLHCSSPSVFNDPFDFKVGIDLQSLYGYKLSRENDIIVESFDKFYEVTIGLLSIEECSEPVQRIIKALSSNDVVMGLVDFMKTVSSPEERTAYIKRNPSIITELLKVVLDDPMMKDSLGMTSEMLPNLLNCLKTENLLQEDKAEPLIKTVAENNGIFEDADEIGLAMMLGSILVPEQKDEIKKAEASLKQVEKELTERMNSLFWIGCLTTDNKNRLMWSHYAEGHSGFCVEYDFSKLKDDIVPFPVIYSDKRPLVPWGLPMGRTEADKEKAKEDLILGLLTKDKAWEYENEWRVLIQRSTSSVQDIELPITAVYLGVNIAEKNRKRVMEIARRKGIMVKQMTIDRGAYELHESDGGL